jgi:hypothetical protein
MEIKRSTERIFVNRLMSLAETSPMPQMRALASHALRGIARDSAQQMAAPAEVLAHRAQLADDIKRFLERPFDLGRPAASPAAPPGAPIGDVGLDYMLGLDTCWYDRRW